MAKGSVKRTICNVSQVYREAGFPDPRLDVNGNLRLRLQQIYRGVEETDPKKNHQKAVPLRILKEAFRLAHESGDKFALAFAQQTIGAYSFAMRSCEYSRTCFHEESKRKRIILLKKNRFFLRRRLVPQSDVRIFQVDMVTISFEWQKNKERDESVSMHSCK